MVQLVAAGESGRGTLLGIFSAWDWIYNSFTYFFEAGYMAGWAFAAWKSGALPRWLAAVGAITAVGHVFNSQVLMAHLSDDLTLIPTAFFFLWFVGTGVYLVRGGKASVDPSTSEAEELQALSVTRPDSKAATTA